MVHAAGFGIIERPGLIRLGVEIDFSVFDLQIKNAAHDTAEVVEGLQGRLFRIPQAILDGYGVADRFPHVIPAVLGKQLDVIGHDPLVSS